MKIFNLSYFWSTWPTSHSRPVVIIVFPHVDRPSVRVHFSKSSKTKHKIETKTMFTTGETVDLAEWIIDDTYVVLFTFSPSFFPLDLKRKVRVILWLNTSLKKNLHSQIIGLPTKEHTFLQVLFQLAKPFHRKFCIFIGIVWIMLLKYN